MTDNHIPTADESGQTIDALVRALLDWTSVLPGIIETTQPVRCGRADFQQQLVRASRKLCEDIAAAALLIGQGFAGPSHALVRVCRENVIFMLWTAMAPPAERDRYVRYATEQRPAAERLRLHRLATSILEEFKGRLAIATDARWRAAVLPPQDERRDSTAAKADPRAAGDFTLNRVVRQLADVLMTTHGEEGAALLTTTIDYWIESEATHSGFDALTLYHVDAPPREVNFDRLRDRITLLLDLRVLTMLANTAVLQGFGVAGRYPAPAQVRALKVATEAARTLMTRLPETVRS